MRFVCDSCRAQYMISDEKVGAKGVKVRCKKCGYVILVRRPEAAAPMPVIDAAKPPPPPKEAEDEGATQVMQHPFEQQGGAASSDLDATHPGDAPRAPAGKRQEANRLLGGVGEDEIGAVFDQVLNSGAHTVPPEPGNGAASPPGALGIDEDDDRMSTRVLDAETVKKLARESGAAPSEGAKPKNGEAQHDWFVAIDDKQVGPMSMDKLKDHWNKGEIGPDSLCWRAGFSDWMPLSEVGELGSVLAPRPAKPVMVAPATVAPVVSVPVESAFNAGGVGQAVRSEVQVPLAAAPVEDTSGGWKPSAASALASLVQEEIEALTKPAPKAPPPPPEEPAPSHGLLDLPPLEEKPASNGKSNGAVARAPAMREDTEPRARMPSHYPMAGFQTSPGFTTYKPPSRTGLIVGFAVGGGVLLIALITVILVLLLRPQPQPVPVAAPHPASAAQPASPAAPSQPAAAAPAAAAPSAPAAAAAPAPSAPAAPSKIEGVTSRETGSGVRSKPTRIGGVDRRERTERTEKPDRSSSSDSAADRKPPKPIEEPVGGDDDDFAREFGGTSKPEPKAKTKEEKPSRKVWVPPEPGGGGDVPESLGQSDIMQVVLSNRSALARCAEEHRKKEPGVSGTLVMRWTVQPSGRTSNVSVVSQEFKATYMAACIGGLVKSWNFPKHKKAGDPVTFPFKF
ncbi:MAG: adventurous gliding motility protein GltJ [Myxococcales bacterium]|nr:adventurous gliding motility protein GltJ [Myxococcales bacterium]